MREVDLSDGVAGRLWVSRLPGRWRPLGDVVRQWQAAAIGQVVCLLPWAELEGWAPEYAELARAGELPCGWVHFPIDDFGVPEGEGIVGVAREVAEALRDGANVLIHCNMGVGRTGTVAACVLLCLGLDAQAAVARVRAAGGDPETVEQGELVAEVAAALGAAASDQGEEED